jgi:RNA polymerase sigma-70 factor (ECF subfamily)
LSFARESPENPRSVPATGGGDSYPTTPASTAGLGTTRLSDREPAELSHSPEGSTLLAEVRCGDRQAFRALYDEFAPEVLALCQRILHHRDDAEDAVADVFWEVWQRRDRYDATRGGARPYLMTLARSRAIDRLRSQAARPEVRSDAGVRTPEQEELKGSLASPEDSAAYSELKLRVAAALAELDHRQREAMELAYYEGLSHQQIADRLTAPLGTVKTHIRKGLAKLRYSLQHIHIDRPR